MRRIISYILIVFIFLWSYNLFVNNFIDLEQEEEQTYKGLIKIADIGGNGSYGYNHHRWMQKNIDDFERKNPGIYIEWIPMDDKVESHKDIEDIPDIVSVDLNFSDFNILESLDDYFTKDELEEFKHQVLKPLNYKKDLKAIPIAMASYGLYLNLEKFNQRGVSPPLNGDWTYEEFVDSLKELSYSSAEEEIEEYGFMAPVGIGNYNVWGIILSDGGEIIDPRRLEYNFYGEKATKGLEKLTDLRNKHKVVAESFGFADEKDGWKMFYEEQNLAVYITGSWAVDKLDKLNKDGEGFNFDLANYPVGDKGLPVVLNSDIVSYGIIKDDDPAKIKACVEVLKYLTADSNQRSLEGTGLFTVKRGINDMYTDNIRMKKIEESLSYTEYIPFTDNWKQIEAIMQDELKQAILGKKLSYEAIEDAKRKIDKINEN